MFRKKNLIENMVGVCIMMSKMCEMCEVAPSGKKGKEKNLAKGHKRVLVNP